jgi:lipoprotein-anchoring transpeptidase ErfK/SrfK
VIHKQFLSIQDLAPINKLLVFKTQRIMIACSDKGCSEPITIATGCKPGTKVTATDWKTPEGVYHVKSHEENFKFYSKYLDSNGKPQLEDGGINLLINYPNQDDLQTSKENNLPIPYTSQIRIHAGVVGKTNCSHGCIRVDPKIMPDIYNYTTSHTEVVIYR